MVFKSSKQFYKVFLGILFQGFIWYLKNFKGFVYGIYRVSKRVLFTLGLSAHSVRGELITANTGQV